MTNAIGMLKNLNELRRDPKQNPVSETTERQGQRVCP